MDKGPVMGQRAEGKSGLKKPQGNLGTFAGVFTPSALTILGIILFLRLGYVVGNAGLGRALIIISLANAISILTSVSLSAIATNLKVKGGGDYYLISRTLGLEFGGAIGIVLFLAQSISIAFYCIGFGEALAGMLAQWLSLPPRIIAILAVSFLFIFAWQGADWATRFQYVVMGLLVAALFSFFTGGFIKWDSAMLAQNWAPPGGSPQFWVLFAIFFPAVTGFTQGVSMSGDLKDPGKSLPMGTFLAVGVSIFVYFGVAIVFAGTLGTDVLANDYGAMKLVARIEFLIDAGVIAATLSSGMASFLGAPRILQSLSGDRIFPFLLPFAKGTGVTGNPRRGVLLSAAIALITIALGNLNLIAPIVSMFFLISYGLLNYATYYEARASSPSFRPRFRWFDYRLSLLGALACLGVMLAIDIAAGVVAISVLFAVFQYLKRTSGPSRWADSRRSYHIQRVRDHLLAAAKEPEHARDWRPQLLAFSNDRFRREQLLHFASWIEGDSGLTTAVRILEGEGAKMLKLRKEAEAELVADIEAGSHSAFPLVVAAPSVEAGVHTLVQSLGIGPLHVNTLLLNWLGRIRRGFLGIGKLQYGERLRLAFRFGCNIVVLDAKEEKWNQLEEMPPAEKRIDVWWLNDATSHLMLLLAYLMTRHTAWSDASIRVLAARNDQQSPQNAEELEGLLDELRIEAEAQIVVDASPDSVFENSTDAGLVFLPFRLRANQMVNPFGILTEDLLVRLPVVAMVLAAEDVDLDAEPEEGKAAEIASARDALADAEKRIKAAERLAAKASAEVEEKRKEMQTAVESGAEKEVLARIEASLKEAEEEATKATRRAAKALAKAENAAREAEALGAIPREKNETPEES
jgi:amino acid transporter